MNGGSIGSGARKFAATWPCRWSTGASGSRRAAASPLAVATPTSSAPTSPGPCVTATSSTSSSVGAGPGERVVDDGVDQLEVVARGDLRHDAAEAVVHALGGDDVGADLAVAGDDRRARVVARRLERQDRLTRRRVRDVVERAAQRRGRAPHDHGVLAVVLVVAPAHPGGAEAEAVVERDRAVVGAADLERVLRVRVVDALEQRGEQRRGDPVPAPVGVDGHVHDVPDRVVARADEVARELPVDERGEADPRRLGQLEHEHRQRPRGRERAALDADDLREIRVGQAADVDRGGRRSGHRVGGLASGSRR